MAQHSHTPGRSLANQTSFLLCQPCPVAGPQSANRAGGHDLQFPLRLTVAIPADGSELVSRIRYATADHSVITKPSWLPDQEECRHSSTVVWITCLISKNRARLTAGSDISGASAGSRRRQGKHQQMSRCLRLAKRDHNS